MAMSHNKWNATEVYKPQPVIVNGELLGVDYHSPVDMIMKLIKMDAYEFARAIRTHKALLKLIIAGRTYPNPPMAKRIQEVARRRGLSVSLDEIYQNVRLDFESPYEEKKNKKEKEVTVVTVEDMKNSPIFKKTNPADSPESPAEF